MSFSVVANPVGGFDVLVNLDGSKVAEYNGLKTVEELIVQDNEYITFFRHGRPHSYRRSKPHRRRRHYNGKL